MEPLYHEDDESREPVPSIETWKAILEERGLRVLMNHTSILPTRPDTEPDAFAIVELPWGWWGLMNVRTGTMMVKIHGPGAHEDIVDRWNVKTAAWLAWRTRQDDGEEGRTETLP